MPAFRLPFFYLAATAQGTTFSRTGTTAMLLPSTRMPFRLTRRTTRTGRTAGEILDAIDLLSQLQNLRLVFLIIVLDRRPLRIDTAAL